MEASARSSILGLMMTWNGTGVRSFSSNSAGGIAFRKSSRSSITANCNGKPTWGAARPTPGASYIVSRMSLMRRFVSALVISSRVKGRASARRTGSPTWTILSRMGETIARDCIVWPGVGAKQVGFCLWGNCKIARQRRTPYRSRRTGQAHFNSRRSEEKLDRGELVGMADAVAAVGFGEVEGAVGAGDEVEGVFLGGGTAGCDSDADGDGAIVPGGLAEGFAETVGNSHGAFGRRIGK